MDVFVSFVGSRSAETRGGSFDCFWRNWTLPMSEIPGSVANVESDRRLRESLGDVGQAFFDFPSLSPVQRAAIPPIKEGRNTLVCAATAAGKTEALLAPLIRRASKAPP